MIKRISIIFATALFISTMGMGLVRSMHASAISGKDFKAGNIIDNATFYDSDSMSTSEIQKFLQSKNPNCDVNGSQDTSYYYNSSTGKVSRSSFSGAKWTTSSRKVYGQRYDDYYNTDIAATPFNCLTVYKQKTPDMPAQSGICGHIPAYSSRTAAQIIHDAATACGISPKVLIVLLQKEQSLVTDDWPWKQEYVHATGFNCPDGSPCDPGYAGFFYQVYYAAHQYKLYEANPGNYNYVAGQNNYIYYNPDHSCGGSWVYIENQATAGLYDYTPYQPNPATLKVGLGTEAPCGAYGNKNFWWLFTDWFGTTHQDYRYSFERLSGTAPAVLPNSSSSLGSYTETFTYGKRIYTFYYDASIHALRLAYWNGNKWSDRIMDGKGSTIPGSTTNDVGLGIAITTYKGNLQVYYYDNTGGNLRHLWSQNGQWHLETLDGSSGSVSRSSHNIGRYIKALNWNGKLQIFYYDVGNGNVRHAWFDNRWHFENLDGDPGSISHYNGNTGASQSITGTIWNNQIQLYYYDASKQALRHAWWPGDGRWHFEWLDGTSGSVIGEDGNRGSNTEAVTMDGKIFVFYYDRDNSSWEEAEYSPDLGWFNQTLDGAEVSLSNSSASVGGQLSAAVYKDHNLQIFYKDHGRGLAHAWAK